MQTLDYAIIAAYLVALAVIGLVVARRAAQSTGHRFLGGRTHRITAALFWRLLTFLLPMGMVLGLWHGVGALASLWIFLLIYLLFEVRRAAQALSPSVNPSSQATVA